jgi:CSLREA domain-containing protein
MIKTRITIRAEGRGWPNVNFQDGKEFTFRPRETGIGDAQVTDSSTSRVMAAADFDSDGTADLVTADANGTLRFYRGNVDSIFPNSPQARRRQTAGTLLESPFYPVEKAFSVDGSPDFLEAGDFNADGNQDVLVLTKGDNRLQLLWGDGEGNFSAPISRSISGQATALAVGEVGRQDGQADVAIAVADKKGARLLVFEHPEGAFKNKPEVFKLSGEAQSIALGEFDGDIYTDIAVACGNTLTIIHGRGQAYPWDRLKDSDIRRPDAVVERRIPPFQITALAAGKFSDRRGSSLAILTDSGTVNLLEPLPAPRKPLNKARLAGQIKPISFVPTGVEAGKVELITPQPTQAEGVVDTSLSPEERERKSLERLAAASAEHRKLSDADKAKLKMRRQMETEAQREREKDGLMRSISARLASPLARWNLQALASDARLVGAANFQAKMLAVRVSASGRDDLVLLDAGNRQIQIVTQTKIEDRRPETEFVSLDSEFSPTAILPMRLNKDALSDLVVLREGSFVPTVLLTAAASTFVVTTTDDNSSGHCDGSEPCSLRRAIELANATPGADEIRFNIPGSGVHTIRPQSLLPDIIEPVTIDARTQPGYSGTPLIEIKGDTFVGSGHGIRINASNSAVSGFAINEMPSVIDDNGSQVGGNGIVLQSSVAHPNNSHNFVSDNFLGTDPTGALRKGNHATGLLIFDSDSNYIFFNVLSGNGKPDEGKRGAGIAIEGGNNNYAESNLIGTDKSGNFRVQNSLGAFIAGRSNVFGAVPLGGPDGNVVSGNGEDIGGGNCFGEGILEALLVSDSTGELLTLGNIYVANRIGTNAAGTAALGNCTQGMVLNLTAQFRLGSSFGFNFEGNLISGNRGGAILIGGGSNGLFAPGSGEIIGNRIGTDLSGNSAIPNVHFNLPFCQPFCLDRGQIWLFNNPESALLNIGTPTGTTPGGDCTGGCNLISGNDTPNTIFNILFKQLDGFLGSPLVVNNYIGTNRSGTSALPNGTGVGLGNHGVRIGAIFDDGNGGEISGGNLISGNNGTGIGVSMQCTTSSCFGQARIEGNLIGTTADGLNALPNTGSGVVITTRDHLDALIGGTNPLARNVIAGNTGDGIEIGNFGAVVSVKNNFIGLNKAGSPLGNGRDGIHANGSPIFDATAIGGIGNNEGNFIRHNGRNGVLVNQFTGGFGNQTLPAENVFIAGNSIASNGALGIDLSVTTTAQPDPDGVTANDCGDTDEGANSLQNYPHLSAPTFNPDGTVTVPGTLRSHPLWDYTIHFYASDSADPSNFGEGETYIGMVSVRTDANGFVAFNFQSPGVVNSNRKITATASTFYETSEFSCVAGQCTDPLTDCRAPIIVNINGDADDADTSDGFCDTEPLTPGLQCSLRAAIQEANARPGSDTISFDIPGSGVQTIAPATELPAITGAVNLLGETQPGYAGWPLIEIRGDLGSAVNGLVISSNGSRITGLTINRFAGAGIRIESANSNIIHSNAIGINPDGMSADASRPLGTGVSITGSSARNEIGSFVGLGVQGNVIGNCSQAGVFLSGLSVKDNRVAGNKIGTNKSGVAPLANSVGVLLDSGANNNFIGDAIPTSENLISGNSQAGIVLQNNAANNSISANLIGADVTGNAALPNGQAGILIRSGARDNTISQRNVISGHALSASSCGIRIDPTANGDNRIFGNYIGTNANGNARLGNSVGVLIESNDASIGVSNSPPNVISGNASQGVLVQSSSAINNVAVRNNFIGTDATGFNDLNLGSPVGVVVTGQVTNTSVTNNVISGNLTGVDISLGAVATVSKNLIGLTANGEGSLPNLIGVAVVQTSDSSITGNTVSGNLIGILLGDGIGPLPNQLSARVEAVRLKHLRVSAGILTENNIVQGNRVGTNATGTMAVRNRFIGIAIGENARNNQIGGRFSKGEGNTVSGQTSDTSNAYGIFIGTLSENPPPEQLPQNNFIQGNRVGIKSAGFETLPNNKGIVLSKAVNNIIGADLSQCGDNSEENIPCDDYGNVVGGNREEGILAAGVETTGNRFVSNWIGIAPDETPIGNGSHGILITNQASGTIIGGPEPNSGNTIAQNGGAGVRIDETAGCCNLVDPNSIFGNAGIGIDIGPEGPTANDPADADGGPNRMQNYPGFTSAVIDAGGNLQVQYFVDSAPGNSNYGTNGLYVEFFRADARLQGKTFIGSSFYTLNDYNNGTPGHAAFIAANAASLGVGPGDRLVATATDADGNTSEFSESFQIPGAGNCTIACPPNQTVNTGTGSAQCGAVVIYPAPTTSGDCGTVTCTPPSGTLFAVGITTVNCATTSGSSCSFTVTVNDTQPPAITCPANITATANAGENCAVVSYTTPTASDNCAGATTSCTPPSGTCFPVGTTTVNCTATDAANNTASCSFTVTVQAAACSITCPQDISRSNNQNQCGAVVNYPAPTTTGGCGTVTCAPISGSLFPVGTTTVNCSSTSGSSCSFTVTVLDNSPPSIVCPTNVITTAASGQCSAPVNYPAPTVTDNCSSVTVACSPPSGSSFPVGITTVNCGAMDASNNTASCSFSVGVNDTQPPAITCPANLTATAASGSTSAVVSYSTPQATDNCSGATVNCLPPSGSAFPLGATTVVCTGMDISTNSVQCSFTITVNTTPPQQSNRILFETNRDGNLEIYVMNGDGTNPTRLTYNHSADANPAWSPDRTKIAFTSLRHGNLDIYVMDADGSNERRLTDNHSIDDGSSWSPDGTKIAFWSFRDGNAEIYVMNADGSNQRRLTFDSREDIQPEWSPDGTKIAFTSNRAKVLNLDIYVMNADGSNVRRVTTHDAVDESPSWSADGTKIAFTSNRLGALDFEVWVMNADGTGAVRLTRAAHTSVRPSWSRDGSKIAFASNRTGLVNFEIYTMNPDGSNQTRLTNHGAIDFAPHW